MAKKTQITVVPAEDDLGGNLVTKSNSLIQASYRLSLQEQRLVLCGISKLDSRKSHLHPRNDQTRVRITALEFAATFGIDRRKAYEELKEAANKLFERRITEIDGRKTTKLRWVSQIEYHDGEGWADLKFNEGILPLLTLLREKFTSYTLRQVANLRSVYSIRIFEMLQQWSSTGMLRIELKDFISRLDLPYARFNDVERRVLNPACAELLVKSNMEVTWAAIREGRAVKTLEFRFKPAAQSQLPLDS